MFCLSFCSFALTQPHRKLHANEKYVHSFTCSLQLHLSHNCSMDNTFKLQSTLCDGIKTIYEDDQMSDVTIKAGDTVIHAHKVVLAAHSASFKAMFQASHCARLMLFCQHALFSFCMAIYEYRLVCSSLCVVSFAANAVNALACIMLLVAAVQASA